MTIQAFDANFNVPASAATLGKDVSGGTLTNPPGQFNQAPCKYAFKERSVGTFNGADQISQTDLLKFEDDYEVSCSVIFNALPSTGGASFTFFGSSVCDVVTNWLSDLIQTLHRKADGSTAWVTSDVIAVVGVLYEIVVTKSGTSLTLDINGIAKTTIFDGTTTDHSSSYIYIGSGGGGLYTNGKIFDISFPPYFAALDEGEGTTVSLGYDGATADINTADIGAFWANTIAPTDIIQADAPWDFFTDPVTYNSIARLESEFYFNIIGLDQYYFGCKGLTVHDSVLAAEDARIEREWQCCYKPVESHDDWSVLGGAVGGEDILCANGLTFGLFGGTEFAVGYQIEKGIIADVDITVAYEGVVGNTDIASFPMAARIVDNTTFIGVRSYNGVLDVYQRINNVFTLLCQVPNPSPGTPVTLSLVGDTVTVTAGTNSDSGIATLLDPGYVGYIKRNTVTEALVWSTWEVTGIFPKFKALTTDEGEVLTADNGETIYTGTEVL